MRRASSRRSGCGHASPSLLQRASCFAGRKREILTFSRVRAVSVPRSARPANGIVSRRWPIHHPFNDRPRGHRCLHDPARRGRPSSRGPRRGRPGSLRPCSASHPQARGSFSCPTASSVPGPGPGPGLVVRPSVRPGPRAGPWSGPGCIVRVGARVTPASGDASHSTLLLQCYHARPTGARDAEQFAVGVRMRHHSESERVRVSL